MTARIKVVHPGVNIFKVIIDDIKANGDEDNCLVIFPNRRAIRFFEYYYAKFSDRKASAVPRAFSINDWLTELVASNNMDIFLMDYLEASWYVYKAVSRLLEDGFKFTNKVTDFESFFPWGVRLVQLFDEFDREMKNVPDLIYIDGLPESILPVVENLGKVYREYKKLTMECGVFTFYGAIRLLLESGISLPDNKMYFVGFYALSGFEERLFEMAFKKGASFYLQADPDDLKQFHRKWIEGWEKKLSVKIEKVYPGKYGEPEFYFFESHDLHSELEELSNKLKDRREPEDPDEIVVVVPDPTIIPALLNYLPYSRVNITAGYPLTHTFVRTFIESLYALVKRYDTERGFKVKELIDFLKLPYIGPLRGVVECLSKKGSVYVTKSELFEVVVGEDSKRKLEEIFENLLDPIISADNLRDLCFVILENLSKFIDSAVGMEKEVLKVFCEELSRIITHYSFISERFSKVSLFEILREMLKYMSVPFEGEPLVGLQVMGLLETRLIPFKEVFIVEANEGLLPGIEDINPVLPRNVRSLFGLPSPDDEIDVIRYYFERLIASAERVYIFWQASVSSTDSVFYDKRLKSRFVERIIWNLEKKEGNVFENTEYYRNNFVRSSVSIDSNVLKSDFIKLTDEVKAYLRNKISTFSATILDEYLFCPIKFFYSRVLELEKPVIVDDEVAYDELGSVVHESLEEYFSSLTGLKRGLVDLRGTEVKRSQLSFEAFKRVYLEKLRSSGFYNKLSLERRYLLELTTLYRLRKYLTELHPEVTRIVALEKDIEMDFEIERHGKFTVKAVLDRVDLRNGVYYILDYKTGRAKGITSGVFSSFSFNEIGKLQVDEKSLKILRKKISSIQMPLYVYLWKERVVPHVGYEEILPVYVKLGRNGEELKAMTYPRGKGSKKIVNSWFEEILPSIVVFIIRHMLESEVLYPNDDKEDCMRFCGYNLICKHSA